MKAYTERTYLAAGTAVGADGQVKVRWANDMVTRVKTMAKQGVGSINVIPLPKPMTRLEGLQYLRTLKLRPDELEAIETKLAEVEAKLDTTPKKRGRKPKAKSEVTIASIRSRKTESSEKTEVIYSS